MPRAIYPIAGDTKHGSAALTDRRENIMRIRTTIAALILSVALPGAGIAGTPTLTERSIMAKTRRTADARRQDEFRSRVKRAEAALIALKGWIVEQQAAASASSASSAQDRMDALTASVSAGMGTGIVNAIARAAAVRTALELGTPDVPEALTQLTALDGFLADADASLTVTKDTRIPDVQEVIDEFLALVVDWEAPPTVPDIGNRMRRGLR